MFTPGHFAARTFVPAHFPGGGGGGIIVQVVEFVQFVYRKRRRLRARKRRL